MSDAWLSPQSGLGGLVEGVAVISTVLSVWWARARDRRTWPAGAVAAIAYGAWFSALQWWGNAAFQLLVLLQAIWGWGRWSAPAVRPLRTSELLTVGVLLAALGGIALTQIAHTPQQQAEWALSLASLAATVGLIQQRPGSWLAWAGIDVGYVALFVATHLWLSTALYAGLTLFAFQTWRQWRTPPIAAAPRPFSPSDAAYAAP